MQDFSVPEFLMSIFSMGQGASFLSDPKAYVHRLMFVTLLPIPFLMRGSIE